MSQSYCQQAKKSTLSYQFLGSKQINVELPGGIEVEVQTLAESFKEVNYDFSFNGQNVDAFSFVVQDTTVPDSGKIYLIEAYWDDWGTIGSYSTGSGILKTYKGAPLLVGKGRQVDGTVHNELPVLCYARGKLAFGRIHQEDRLIVTKDGLEVYRDEGQSLKWYKVSCDDECPPGHHKCPSNKYPGYCCLNCAEIAARINNLANR
jgi:hypothetical protein